MLQRPRYTTVAMNEGNTRATPTHPVGQEQSAPAGPVSIPSVPPKPLTILREFPSGRLSRLL